MAGGASSTATLLRPAAVAPPAWTAFSVPTEGERLGGAEDGAGGVAGDAGAAEAWGAGARAWRGGGQEAGASPDAAAGHPPGEDLGHVEALGAAARAWRGGRGGGERAGKEGARAAERGWAEAGAVALEGLGYDAETQQGESRPACASRRCNFIPPAG